MTSTAQMASDHVLACLKALGDEKRLRIVLLLSAGERCVCDLQDALGAGQSLLSFHLKTLRDAGLVTDRREGRWVYYRLAGGALAELGELLTELGRTPPPPSAHPARCCD